MSNTKWIIEKEYKEACVYILQDNLVFLRAKAGINQEQLSSIIGISRQTYQAIESKKKQMSWTVFLALMFFFYMLDDTKTMIDDLSVFPLELFMKFNNQLVRRSQNG